MNIPLDALVAIVCAAIAGNGIVQFLINRRDRRNDKTSELSERISKLEESQKLCVKANLVILNALHDGKFNGETEAMRDELNAYLLGR